MTQTAKTTSGGDQSEGSRIPPGRRTTGLSSLFSRPSYLGSRDNDSGSNPTTPHGSSSNPSDLDYDEGEGYESESSDDGDADADLDTMTEAELKATVKR